MDAVDVSPNTGNMPPSRDLGRYVQCFDNALDPSFCAQLIESFERTARLHSRSGRGVFTQLQQSAWTELNVGKIADADMKALFRNQVLHHLGLYNERVDLTLPIPPRERTEDLRIKRYTVESGDQFQPHFDAMDYNCNRYLVYLWYLNDVSEGGETEFPDLEIRVAAQAGRLVMFPPYWMFQHAGLPPRSNDKYIISTYLLF